MSEEQYQQAIQDLRDDFRYLEAILIAARSV